jgi:hypothetical protein
MLKNIKEIKENLIIIRITLIIKIITNNQISLQQ